MTAKDFLLKKTELYDKSIECDFCYSIEYENLYVDNHKITTDVVAKLMEEYVQHLIDTRWL